MTAARAFAACLLAAALAAGCGGGEPTVDVEPVDVAPVQVAPATTASRFKFEPFSGSSGCGLYREAESDLESQVREREDNYSDYYRIEGVLAYYEMRGGDGCSLQLEDDDGAQFKMVICNTEWGLDWSWVTGHLDASSTDLYERCLANLN